MSALTSLCLAMRVLPSNLDDTIATSKLEPHLQQSRSQHFCTADLTPLRYPMGGRWQRVLQIWCCGCVAAVPHPPDVSMTVCIQQATSATQASWCSDLFCILMLICSSIQQRYNALQRAWSPTTSVASSSCSSLLLTSSAVIDIGTGFITLKRQ